MADLVLFEEKQVRRVWSEAERRWYFSVQDVIEILTGSADVKQYVKKLKSRDPILGANWGTICTLVEMTAADGKRRKVQAAHTEGRGETTTGRRDDEERPALPGTPRRSSLHPLSSTYTAPVPPS